MNWLELSVTADIAAVEAVSALFSRHGEGGVAIDEPFYTDPDGERYGIDTARPPLVKTYLPDTEDGAARRQRIVEGLWHLSAFDLAPIGQLQVRSVVEDDWANAWKEHYHPLRIGRLLIRPSWRPAQYEPGLLEVELDPGMAFGTGVHQTTRMCLAALERLVEPGWTVLDQGAGSGILAVAAARLGASRVLARDISEVAIEATTENAARNGLSNRITVQRVDAHAAPLDQVLLAPRQQRAHLVVANIIATVLVRLADAFARVSHPGALLIASGIIRERAREVEEALQAAGYAIAERIGEDEWVTLIGRLAGSSSPASS